MKEKDLKTVRSAKESKVSFVRPMKIEICDHEKLSKRNLSKNWEIKLFEVPTQLLSYWWFLSVVCNRFPSFGNIAADS